MLDRIDINKPVVVMCQTGFRSKGACRILSKIGHKEVYNFKRGIRNYRGTITRKKFKKQGIMCFVFYILNLYCIILKMGFLFYILDVTIVVNMYK